MSKTPLRIGIVAGEVSGDILGSGLIKALKEHYPDAIFEGIGGERMIKLGCKSHFAMEELSVMGLVEVLGRLRRLLDVRKQLVQHFIDNPPDVFIGIDAPDFNLGVEQRLKAKGIKTVHYVSPSVWAWRKKRIFKIKEAADLVLCLLPFEQQIYKDHDIGSAFVGHTLADDIPLISDKNQARQTLGLNENGPVLAVLPGSRGTELAMLAEPFLRAAVLLQQKIKDLVVIIPIVNEKRKKQLLEIKAAVAPNLNVKLMDGQSREVMTASDVIMLASGTATLEAALIKRPMIVSYKFKWLTYQIMSRLVTVRNFSLPNLLAEKTLVPEVLQDDVTPEYLCGLALGYFNSDNSELIGEFEAIHHKIRLGASEHSALAVLKLIGLEAIAKPASGEQL